MKRTQIQLPDDLYALAHRVADYKEISLAELVRRGLEYMVAVTPESNGKAGAWSLPVPHPLNAVDPFRHEDWRAALHQERLRVAENRATYRTRGKK